MSEIRSHALSRQVVSKTRASSSSLPVVAVAESRDEPHNVERAERFDALVFIPSHDGTIALLRQHRTRLEQRVRIALANEPALRIAVNKEQTLKIARSLGMHVPPSVMVRSDGDV